MGDFFTSPIGSPLPPPEPDIPPPNFEQIADGIGAGFMKSGLVTGILAPLFGIFVSAFTAILSIAIKLLVYIFAYLVKVLGDATQDAQGAYGTLVAATLHELFGVTVNPADVATRTSGPGRQAVANSMGKTLLGTLFSGAAPIPTGGIVPTDEPVNNYLATVLNMELNGWIESWVTDGLSGHVLEKYGDLKDGIARVLGLGRLSRQAFRAPMKILVTDPYTELLSHTYRPKQWPEALLIRQLIRGQIQRSDLSTPLGNQGYTEAQIDELVLEQQKVLSQGDLDYLDQRGLSFGTFWHDQLVAQGYAAATADTVIQIARDKRTQKYREQMVTVGEAAYVAGNIGPDTFATILSNSGVTQDEQDWISQLAQLKIQVKVRHLSEGEIIKGIEDGILNFTDLQTWGIREGLSAQDLATLELETQFAENKASALAQAKAATAAAKVAAANSKLQLAKEKAATAQAQASDKGISAAQAGTLVKDGIWTIAQYTTFLSSRGYGPDAITSSVQLLQAEMNAAAVKTAAAAGTKASAAAKGLNLAQMEKGVVEGIITAAQLLDYLTGHGYDAADAQVIVDLTNNALTAAQVKADAAAAARAKAATKSISLPDLERSVRLGLTTQDVYNAALQKANFDVMSITLLDGILQSQIASDTATAAKRATTAAAATSKGVTIAQLEQEVINGIRPITDYSAELNGLGYDSADQQQLTALLQLKVDQAAATAAKKAAATKALAAKGISLPDAERAVKLGVVPISTYQALLQSLNYTPDAVDVLSNTLLAQVAATKKAQTAATAATAALATKSISLPDIERAVVAGLMPIGTYTAALTSAGYSAGDAGTLTDLLQLKVDQAARAKTTHADAEGVATQKGISLASEEAAVVAGDKTMADYNALLNALGYDAVDIAVLDQLLQAKVDAKAAKAATSTPAAPATSTAT